MPDARVTDVAALADFRVVLAEFTVAARQALIDIDLEVRRALEWIGHDRAVHWQSEVRRSTDAVARAKDDLSNSRTYKRVGDHVPACLEEKKALEIAKRRLEQAEGKVQAVRRWGAAVRRAVDEFQGPVQQLTGILDGDLPRAMALLDRMIAALERYTAIGAPAAIKWEELTGQKGGSSMALPVDDVEAPPSSASPAENSLCAEPTIDMTSS